MNKLKTALIVGFIITFAAGTSMGLLVNPKPKRPGMANRQLVELLDLSNEQQESIQQITRQMTLGRLFTVVSTVDMGPL